MDGEALTELAKVALPLPVHAVLPLMPPESGHPVMEPAQAGTARESEGHIPSDAHVLSSSVSFYPWHPARVSSVLSGEPLPPAALAPLLSEAADSTSQPVVPALAASLRTDVQADTPAAITPTSLAPASALAAPPVSVRMAESVPALAPAMELSRTDWMVASPQHKGLPEWAPVTLTPGKPEHWGEALRNALGERLQLQSAHGMDKALIRLDPPAMGALEIAIRHEAGVLAVQLTASNPDVVRQLQAMGESLRQDLLQRQQIQVSVEVREGQAGSGQGQGRQEGQRRDERTPGKALYEADVPGDALEAEPGLSRV